VMYDILLHQVNLNWTEFLASWAKKARVLVIYNQNWDLDPHTVRFIERGKEWYKQHVFHTRSEAIDRWFAEHDAIDPQLNCPRRDVHNFWQWGITRNDLVAHVESLGYRMSYFQDYGAFMNKAHIPQQGFVFARG
jgi:nicotinamidase-related amidase